jgi:predicted Zn-dependent protease
MSAGILRALGLGELVATDEASYLQLASNLALDPARRTATVDQLALAMDSMPNFLDPLAASDAFGALVELALEEIAQKGHETFRSSREPLALPDIDTAATLAAASALLAENQPAEAARRIRSLLGRHPSLPAARHLMGRALLAQHSPARAQLYLLDAIQHDGQNPQLWHDLACAFRINGLHNESVQAAQTCLRLDERNLDGWLLIAEISRSSGHASLLEDSIQMAHQLAPTDPRVIALMSRTRL